MKKRSLKKGYKRVRAIIILVLIILLLLLLDGRFGFFGNGLGIINTSSTTEINTSKNESSQASRLVIEIRENSIFYVNEPLTLEQLEERIIKNDDELLYVLKDVMANYSLFTQVETLLKNHEKSYIIEQ